MGGIFEINLSGFRGIIIADSKALSQIRIIPNCHCLQKTEMLPDEILSSYDGIIDIGFRDALGPENVFFGYKRYLSHLS